MHHLYPIESETREIKPLCGVWNFLIDPDGNGQASGWAKGLPPGWIPMTVPSSYNDLTGNAEIRDYVGDVWYERKFFIPSTWSEKDIFIRFGSATHHAAVWVNGVLVAEHKGGYLPFAGRLNEAVRFGEENCLVVRLGNILDWTTLPPGEVETIIHPDGSSRRRQKYFHDFFNYAGIHRPVVLAALPRRRIENLRVATRMEEGVGIVECDAEINAELEVRVRLLDEAGREVAAATGTKASLRISEPRLWWPMDAYLYTLEITAEADTGIEDVYRLPVGLRTVKVKDDKFLVNGEPFYFRGFGWHEDSDIRGKGYDAPTMLRDLNLMREIGANSFRTSHYPYAEETLRLADRMGFVVIAETPAVGLFHGRPNEQVFCETRASEEMQRHHLEVVREMIARDRNHPCVVMWSIGNEPANNESGALAYFSPIVAEARKLDPSRPVTIVDHLDPEDNTLLELSDVICINKYHGWYDHSGALERVEELFVDTIRRFHDLSGGKPVLLSEHGVDTVAGLHQVPAIMFSEEYQVEWLEKVHSALDRSSGVIGEHVWVFADFATAQSVHRVGGNKKGVFTRQRQPKMAASYLRARWQKLDAGCVSIP